MSARQRTYWGWHRLDPRFARRLVADAGVRPGDLVLDVGAGSGVLTAALVAADARVIAIELHPGRLSALRDRFGDSPVRVVSADARDLRLPRRPFRVVANPPFAVTAGLLRRLVTPRSRLVQADLVVPRHVAARWASRKAPGVGRWAEEFEIGVIGTVPRRLFRPPPRQDAAHLRIQRRDHYRPRY